MRRTFSAIGFIILLALTSSRAVGQDTVELSEVQPISAERLLSGTEGLWASNSNWTDYCDGKSCGGCSSCRGSRGCGGCGCCDDCSRLNYWITADYLVWWLKGNRVPALVTTSPVGTPRAAAGVLGQPGTSILFGDDRIDTNFRIGGRATAGFWLDDCALTGIEANWLSVGDGANNGNYFNQSTGSPILARPFFNLVTGLEDSQLVAFPLVVEGSIQVLTSSEMHSAGLVIRRNVMDRECFTLDFLGGYRYLRFREGLIVEENLTSTDPGGVVAQGTTIDVFDRFSTANDFHGVDFGLSARLYRREFSVDLLAKIAVGNVHQQLNIEGNTLVTAPGGGPSANSAGGLFALPTNIGGYSRDELAILPEIGLNLHYHFTDRFHFTAGYTLLLATDMLRTGDQIDRVINTSQLPVTGGGLVGGARPGVIMNDTTLWAQGLSFGLSFER